VVRVQEVAAHVHPFPYSDVNRILADVLDGMQRILGDALLGLYLYGSLAAGDFDPVLSDIDLLAVLSYPLDDAEFGALDRMHQELVAMYPAWDDRIEIGYMTHVALKTYRTQSSTIAIISPGEPFHRKEAGKDWLLNWYVVREQGLTLFGPPPNTLIGPIHHDEYIACVRAQTREWAEWIYHMTLRKQQAYAILTMCRALYAVHFGVQTSKRAAAAWAAERLPQWSPLIANALEWRAATDDANVDHAATFPETVRFVNFVIDSMESTSSAEAHGE
jgi:hypothetical protein